MSFRRNLSTGVVVGLVALMLAVTARAEEVESPTVGEAVVAEPTPVDETVIVFPVEGVNVDPGIARAATVFTIAELTSRGFDVVDLRLVEHEMFLKAKESARLERAAEVVAPPPPPPGASTESGQSPAPVPPTLVVADPGPLPPVTDEQRRQIAYKFKADMYFKGNLVSLGNQIYLDLGLYSADGVRQSRDKMPAKGEDDLSIVIPRLTESLLTKRSIGETLTLDNATMAESTKLPNRFKLEVNLGPIIGMAISMNSHEMKSYPTVAFDARLEINEVFAELQAGLGFSGDNKTSDYEIFPGTHIFVNIAAAYYLTHTNIAPYLGAGGGFFLGERFRAKKKQTNGLDVEYKSADSGLELFPLVGLEFMRHARIRLHLDCRYMFNIAQDSHFGHGPQILIGINF